jgi:hypothetical protein
MGIFQHNSVVLFHSSYQKFTFFTSMKNRSIAKPIPSNPVYVLQFLFIAGLSLKFKSLVSVLNVRCIGSAAVTRTFIRNVESIKPFYSISPSKTSNYSKSFFLILTSLYMFIVGVVAVVALDHIHWPTHTKRRTLLHEASALSQRPARFEPAIPASEQPQTQALDAVVTGIG